MESADDWRNIIDPAFRHDVEQIAEEMTAILCRRQIDYGAGNINNAFGGAMNGLLVRMGDKYERIKNLTASGQQAQGERLEDSFIDLANYSIIALMVLRGSWPRNNDTTSGGNRCREETTNATPPTAVV